MKTMPAQIAAKTTAWIAFSRKVSSINVIGSADPVCRGGAFTRYPRELQQEARQARLSVSGCEPYSAEQVDRKSDKPALQKTVPIQERRESSQAKSPREPSLQSHYKDVSQINEPGRSV